MSVKENKAIVRRFYEGYYGKHDDAVLDELVSPDYVYWGSGVGGWRSSQSRGPQVLRGIMPTWLAAFPDLSFTITDMIFEGDKVLVVTLWRGTHKGDYPWGPGGQTIKATGKSLAGVGMNILRLSGGKIVEEWESSNYAALFQQLGAI